MSSSYHSPVGLPRRLAALLYDSLLVIALLFAATLPWLLLGDTPTINDGDVLHELTPVFADGHHRIFYQLYLLLVIVVFFSGFWCTRGQTLGMQAWRLRVQQIDGQNITLGQSLLRIFGACLSIACFGLGYWWIICNKQRLSWHDYLSGTRVILT